MNPVSCGIAMFSWVSRLSRSSVLPVPMGLTMKIGPLPGAGSRGMARDPRQNGYPEDMTELIIIVAILVMAALVFLVARRRSAERALARERLVTEAQVPRQELEANAAKARQSQEQSDAHRKQFEE